MKLPLGQIRRKQDELYNHPLLAGNIVRDLASLQIFMEHHVYAVWDFMSLLKSLQHRVCPSTDCWVPNKWTRAGLARLVNEIVLGEESDIDLDGNGTITHHDLYAQAMLEIGADGDAFEDFIEMVRNEGFRYAIQNAVVPYPAASFMETTFDFIESNKPHVIAAAFCFGRETSIPNMFQKIADNLSLQQMDAPKFHYYLERHIHLDGEEHGPASIQLVEALCENDPVHIHEAEQAALEAIQARIDFWDDVQYEIENNKLALTHD